VLDIAIDELLSSEEFKEFLKDNDFGRSEGEY